MAKDLTLEIVKENLKIGETYKYKELCQLFGVEQKRTGNPRIAQFREWKQYFDWENPTTQQIKITKIYDKPIEKIDKRHDGNNAKYRDNIQLLLVDCLLHNQSKNGKTYSATKSLKGWYITLGMANKNYRDKEKDILLKETYGDFSVKKFYSITHKRFKQMFVGALEKLANNSVITYHIHTVIVEKGDIDEYGQYITGRHRKATQEEESKYLEMENEVIQHIIGDYNDKFPNAKPLRNKSDIYLNGLGEQYEAEISESLNLLTNWCGVYEEYEIIYSHNSLKNNIEWIEENATIVNQARIQLNNDSISAIKTSAISEKNKNLKKIEERKKKYLEEHGGFGEMDFPDWVIKFKYSEDFLDNMTGISDNVLKIKK